MKTTKLISVLLIALMTASLILSGCGSSTTSQSTQDNASKDTSAKQEPAKLDSEKKDTAANSEKKLRFVYLSPDQANPYWQRVEAGFKEEAKKNNIEVVTLDGAHDPAKQLSAAEDAIRQKFDAVLLSPYETDTGTTITEECNKAKIPVFILDVGTGGDYQGFIISDNKAGGVLAGEYMMKVVGKDAPIFEMQGILGRKIPALRGDGFNEVMDKNGVKLVGKQPADFVRNKGMIVMENALTTNPNIKGVFCWNDEMAMGAIEAIAAKKKEVTVIGFDGNKDAVQAVKDGKLAATVAQQPKQFGITGVQMALKYLKGEKYEKDTYIPCALITKENADQFLNN